MYEEMFVGPRCLLSHPANSPHNLSIRYGRHFLRLTCFTCGGKKGTPENDCIQYYCTICDVEFHNGCHRRPRKITHPYHLQHPLTLFYRNPETGIISDDFIPEPSSPEESDTSDQGKPFFVQMIPFKSDIVFDKCTWCRIILNGDWSYRCLICSFCLDLSCAETVPLVTIPNPKNHPHSLLLLPRPTLTPCDTCGLVNVLEPSYACFQCNYMAHGSCIDLPRVIKITRHPHRLSCIPYRSPVISSCQICYKNVDIKYGQYSCNQEDCSYVAHSTCATHKNVWDGTELEWEKEEADETEDMSPFKILGDGLIQHLGHIHPLKLKKHDGVGDTEKQCQACVFPIISHQFYYCEECNYSLHEVCAGLSRKLDHALHNHTLILDPSPKDSWESRYYCSACSRPSTGFRYICPKKSCIYIFKLDVRCVSVPECFVHKSHEHPIFLSTSHSSTDENHEILCKGCKKRCSGPHLQCTVCEFALCYPCGTIPNEVQYRFDKHPLTLSCGESADDIYWCEVCEKQLDTEEWFYACNKCCTTVHRRCIFGSSYFMKPGSIFDEYKGEVEVFRNSSNTRPICYECRHRCTSSIYYLAT
ncbi:unnamed protein product [Microthlaspi erraticum]|uniref:Zinc finger PHD-type domain-containing protein n=1 Tax=Microthlaspi erraticum TaxID=1685480 RepID=A0A6D2HN27_9BRAS|nr:unnamed protein product [Microthlaspi erraticum]